MADYYRIRIEWNNGKWDSTQKGAFTSLAIAIEQCTEELIKQGYKVFSPTGKILYPVSFHSLSEQMYKDEIITDRQYWTDVFEGTLEPELKQIITIIEKYSEKLNQKTSTDKEVIPDVNVTITPAENDAMITKLTFSETTIYKIPAKHIKIKWFDKKKITGNYPTYFNAGYFGNFKEDNISFTLPTGNLIADINTSSINSTILKYLKERKITNNKLYFSASKNTDVAFRQSNVSTLFIDENDQAYIQKINGVENATCKYAVSGAPVIIANKAAKNNYTTEGWDNSIVRNTTHTFVGTKKDLDDYVYIFTYKTTSSNCFTSNEIYNKFKNFGFYNLIKLDGGGSAYAKVENRIITNTSENRHINNIIVVE